MYRWESSHGISVKSLCYQQLLQSGLFCLIKFARYSCGNGERFMCYRGPREVVDASNVQCKRSASGTMKTEVGSSQFYSKVRHVTCIMHLMLLVFLTNHSQHVWVVLWKIENVEFPAYIYFIPS